MASNIQVQRICQFCNKEFTARTTVTRYCSDNCSKRGYKARKRAEKIEKSQNETKTIKAKPISDIKEKEFLTVSDVATLLNFSQRTVYRLIKQGTIKGVNIAQRKTLVRRTDIDKLFELPPPQKPPQPIQYKIEDCYSIGEVLNKYSVSEKAIQGIISRNSIPKQKQGKFTYVPKRLIDKVLT